MSEQQPEAWRARGPSQPLEETVAEAPRAAPIAPSEFDVLFICTGNICRSAMAEVVAADRLSRGLGEHAPRFSVASAGTHGLHGQPIERTAARTLEAYGLAAPEFRARMMDPWIVEGSDLILTATRRHRAAAVTLVPKVSTRTFTILEFARLITLVPDAELPEDGDPVAYAKRLVARAAARRGEIWVEPHLDEIDDPYGLTPADFDVCGQIIVRAVDAICRTLCAPLLHSEYPIT